jgi:hypothetical protein
MGSLALMAQPATRKKSSEGTVVAWENPEVANLTTAGSTSSKGRPHRAVAYLCMLLYCAPDLGCNILADQHDGNVIS